MAAQRLEERLKAATNQEAKPAVVDLHFADPEGRCDLAYGGRPTNVTSTRLLRSSSAMPLRLRVDPSQPNRQDYGLGA